MSSSQKVKVKEENGISVGTIDAIPKACLKELGPVLDGARQHPAVNKVKALGEGPRQFNVVDIKSQVRWDAVAA